MKDVIDTNWLAQHLEDPNLVILDASQSSSIKKQEHAVIGEYIPHSIAFSLKEFSDPESDLPNTLPKAEWFTEKCRELGIDNSSKIVIYDNVGVYWSPRVWWMFKTMGHEEVAVLDGGLPAWTDVGKQTVDSITLLTNEGDFTASLNKDLIKSLDDVTQNLQSKAFKVVDARSEGRFNGTSPEPREGLQSGHIPDSFNIPFEKVLNDGHYKPTKELREFFEEVDNDKPLVFSCGSGLTACIVSLAHTLVYDRIDPIYDGSWTEWAQSGRPINIKGT